MCTAATYKTKDFYFGRTLDYFESYGEKIIITPEKFPFHFRKVQPLKEHYAMIGMAIAVDGYPLYYDATNEAGLSMAGLNFPGNADYKEEIPGKDNIAPFEFIPWILGRCRNVEEAKELLSRINIVKINFSSEFPLAPLHWIISDRDCSITVECVKDGMKIYDNPVGILTNNPTFDMHMVNLNNYMNLSPNPPVNRFSEQLNLREYSVGMGAMGLPGDLSSGSRFVRAAFVKMNSVSGDSESESVSQFFHILGAVSQQRGCACTDERNYEYTIYSSCCNTDKGIYYYTTYENSQITCIDMNKENLDGRELVIYPLIKGQQIKMGN